VASDCVNEMNMLGAIILLLEGLLSSAGVAARKPDPALERAIAQARPGGEAGLCFGYAQTDLDGDGRPEVVVAIVEPSRCDLDGCTVCIYRRARARLSLVSCTDQLHDFRVERHSGPGWHQVVVLSHRVYWRMRLEGGRYPRVVSDQNSTPLFGLPGGAKELEWTRWAGCK
jgi:hypothetical protein